MFTGSDAGSGPSRSGHQRASKEATDGLLVDAVEAIKAVMKPCTRKGRRQCGPECAVHVRCAVLDKEEMLGYLIADILLGRLIPQRHARSVGEAARLRATKAAPAIMAARRRGAADLVAEQRVVAELPLPSRRQCDAAAKPERPPDPRPLAERTPLEQAAAHCKRLREEVTAMESTVRQAKRARDALGPRESVDDIPWPRPPSQLGDPRTVCTVANLQDAECKAAWLEREKQKLHAAFQVMHAEATLDAVREELSEAQSDCERLEACLIHSAASRATANDATAAKASRAAAEARAAFDARRPPPAPPLLPAVPPCKTVEHIQVVLAATLDAERAETVRQAMLDVWQAAGSVGAVFYLHDTTAGWAVSRDPPPTPSDSIVHACVSDCLSDCVLSLERNEIRSGRPTSLRMRPKRAQLSICVPHRVPIPHACFGA
jgi:hypothetical protein